MSIYKKRQKLISAWLAQNNIALALIEDFEHRRDLALRWLTGHPMDALLFISAAGRTLLFPWDTILAEKMACADEIIPYTSCKMDMTAALKTALEKFDIHKGGAVELPSTLAHTTWLKLTEKLSAYEFICREDGLRDVINNARIVKDEDELRIYRKVSALTDELINTIEEKIRDGALKTESDTALFIEKEARLRGCEGTGFGTLCAGPARSFGIHCFPGFTSGAFAEKGLSILDFGLVYEGYTSDVTMSFARAPLSKKQEEMIELVETAAALGISLVRDGAHCREIGKAIDDLFKQKSYAMPHGLGHGIGLEAHEEPRLNSKDDNSWRLKSGMIVTIEPGLYDTEAGGVRLENDVLVQDGGREVLTNSRIVKL